MTATATPRRPCTCDRVTGPVYSKGQCWLCWLYRYDQRHRAAWGGGPVPGGGVRAVGRRPLPCVHEGHTCSPPPTGRPGRTYLRCDAGMGTNGVVCRCDCNAACPRFEADADDGPEPAPEPTAPGPARRVRVDATELAPGIAFNASAIEYKGRVLMAYRTGWAGANVHVCELRGPDYEPGPSVTLHGLRHARANYGREDPRLFVQGGRLHVAFIGVRGGRGRVHRTDQLFARLSDELKVEDVFAPAYPGTGARWEKNWQFFDSDGGLKAVHTIRPHTVLDVRSNAATLLHRTGTPGRWAGGHLRGGASPVRVGDEWYCWFHGKLDSGPAHLWEYSAGVYTFDAAPPYRMRRITPVPLLRSDPATRPADQYCPVVFPCGAFLRGGTWVVSMGVHDRHIEIAEWNAKDVETALIDV